MMKKARRILIHQDHYTSTPLTGLEEWNLGKERTAVVQILQIYIYIYIKQKCKSVLGHWYGPFILCASNHKTQHLTVLGDSMFV